MPNFTTSDGCPIDYTLYDARHANAPRLALIHSLALDRSIWDGAVGDLGCDMHVVAYDCRGHGRSGKPSGPYSVEQFARDLAELFDHLGWPPAAVAGCSMGGMVAQAFGGLYPGRATALGLIDTSAWYGPDAPKEWDERAANVRAKGFKGVIDFQLSRWFGDKFRAEHTELVDQAKRVFLAGDLDAYENTCTLLGAADVRPFLAGMKIPVAVIVGEEDYATPVAMAQQMHEAIAGSTLSVLPHARHLTPIENADKVAAELSALIGRVAA